MMRCADCRALYPDRFPGPGALAEAYADYYTARPARTGWRGWLRDLFNRPRRSYLRRDLPSGARRLLDFGCGSGAYLAAVRSDQPGCVAFGTDLGPRPAGPLTFTWLDQEGMEAEAPFDWITLGHVLEHLRDPGATVARLGRRLSPNAGLWVATPNSESFIFRAAGRWARDVDFPRHREVFSRRGLERLIGEVGFYARFTSPPRINAVLNVISTLGMIMRDHEANGLERARAAGAVLTGLAIHCLSPARTRLASAPELIATCRIPPGALPTTKRS